MALVLYLAVFIAVVGRSAYALDLPYEDCNEVECLRDLWHGPIPLSMFDLGNASFYNEMCSAAATMEADFTECRKGLSPFCASELSGALDALEGVLNAARKAQPIICLDGHCSLARILGCIDDIFLAFGLTFEQPGDIGQLQTVGNVINEDYMTSEENRARFCEYASDIDTVKIRSCVEEKGDDAETCLNGVMDALRSIPVSDASLIESHQYPEVFGFANLMRHLRHDLLSRFAQMC